MIFLPRARKNDLVTRDLDTEVLIYDFKINKAFNLNATLKIIYEACDGKTSFAELKAKHKFTDDLIFLALDELSRENLLEQDQPYQSSLAGLSRREAVRKIGFASMIALPIISSIVAPTAAQSASGGLPLLASCSSNSQCESNFCTNGPPRCCVPGTSGIRNVSIVCCTAGVNCDTQCCVGAVPSSPSAICSGFGGSQVSCP